eukprot:GGOE01001924.1.p1 GENE.GGOE01001924.1~~GGOE01001924.1.p1  ORF type:complete len:145 (-),score=31.55 GGOE01001924.1:90-524(-)
MPPDRSVPIGITAIVFLALSLWLYLPRRPPADSFRHPQPPNAWVLEIRLRFKSISDRDNWINIWRPAAAYVKQSEPVALSYQLAISDQDPLQALVFERYTSKKDYLAIHRASPAFHTFKKAAKESSIVVEMDGHSYTETDAGFV